MSFPPEAYLIGAQKAGTTTLAYLLDQHPRLVMARTKEPHFYTDRWDKGLGWYEEQFPDTPNALYLDASTSYSMAPLTAGWERRDPKIYEGVPAKLSSVSPGAKFIYLLRDPVHRTYSGYWHDVRMGVEKQSFKQAFLNNPFYLDVSDYYGQLLRWLDYFAMHSFLFVLFEEMREDPEGVVRDCHEFLGVETSPIRVDAAQNQSYRVGWVGRSINRLAVTHPGFRTAVGSVVPTGVKRLLTSVKSGSGPVPTMKEEDGDFLAEYFRERNEDLERLIGRSLARWTR